MRPVFWIILGTFIFLLGVFSFFLGGNISVMNMFVFLDSLLVVSSIIFGIVGAWLAIIWQNEMSISHTGQKKQDIGYLKTTVFLTFVVIFFVLATRFLYPILINVPHLTNDCIKKWLKRGFVFCSGISGIILLLAMTYSLLSFDFFSFEKEHENQIKAMTDEMNQKQMSQAKKHEANKTHD
ncbi:MAG: hypothetical protein LBI26_03415 [Holosporales bacterium]|jgi:drug/metabolite transporter (DMT)-like permease|nr:hypothetical protein [Holosporales bacterium]